MTGDAGGLSHFGEHLTFDGYNGDFDALNDQGVVLAALIDLSQRLEMRALCAPAVHFAAGSGGKDPGGWTGFLVVQESHISIHTFPSRGFLSADVYTCKNGMDTATIVTFFAERFGVTEHEVNFIRRGLKYPSSNLVDHS